MTMKLDGRPVVQYLREDMKKRIAKLAERGQVPTILIIRVGDREDDLSYERSILKNCEILGINSVLAPLPATVSQEDLIELIEKFNEDDMVHGIMLFNPLPPHLDLNVIRKTINPIKDIDSINPANLERVFEGNVKGIAPCTPKAVIEMLKYYNIPLVGANVAMVGSSLVVGKPLSMLLLDEKATVTLCHSKTKNLAKITNQADIVVVAIGRGKFLKEEYFNDNTVIVDVGINDDGNGKICGDVDYDQVFGKVKAISPPLGGVGVITTTILLSHVIQACEGLNPIE
ncbi:bifunctional 5,10-methylenetetrahydrofolate dehydrogenase/5,10-methenyltetrahydrofolate cyclohydrolase [Alkaliphilus transvaalensis]|uniref:bifunctional 5,10-methylenetetrahydrofolate dehydrogenase/5,10-methenyltetrahydrofolate cyclohydrolase n=1 Tax=Alkaliphilus transvaalensis TaxID=114628 RepID=UPI00047AAE15|nr:bifunctional 5,10-methylenetetrahydrofolate dehydrogenase/5,10-methenyltetrahydrofolate cyclohydrolase [Alkaliphilus transvaalensis]